MLPHHSTGGILWLTRLCVRAERHAATASVPAVPEGPGDKALISVRLTDSDGVAGLSGRDRPCTCVLTASARNWLRVLCTAELPHIDQGVRQSLHAKESLLHVCNTKKQPIERILPRKGPIDASPQGMESDV